MAPIVSKGARNTFQDLLKQNQIAIASSVVEWIVSVGEMGLIFFRYFSLGESWNEDGNETEQTSAIRADAVPPTRPSRWTSSSWPHCTRQYIPARQSPQAPVCAHAFQDVLS